MTISLPIIISVISLIVAISSVLFSVRKDKKERYERLNAELNKLIEIAIQYPYVESKRFTSKWSENKDSDDEKYLRYDMFCNRLYNHLHNVCIFFDYDKQKIEDFVDVKSWIRLHKQNWLNPVDENENIDGYDKQFRDFINSYIV